MKSYPVIISFLFILYLPFCMSQENLFFQPFKTNHNVPPFNEIKTEHFVPAFEAGMEEQLKEINAITGRTAAPSFENTVVALDESGELLGRVSAVFYALMGAETTPEIQQIAMELSPKLSEHSDNIMLNDQLFSRIKQVYDKRSSLKLTTEQEKLLEKYYKQFVRSGISLNPEKKERLREINKELSSLSLKFGQNLLAETANFELVIEDKKDLSGLPEDIIAVASEAAKSKGHSGKWVFTLSKPSWTPFLQYADNRELRETLYKAMYNRCDNDNQYDNKALINQIVNLRLEKANLLGYKTHADFVLEQTMAKTPDAVFKLLSDIWEHALPQAKKELSDLQELVRREGKNFKIESWDWWYYTEKLRKEKYNLNEEELQPYFMVDNVRDGVFMVANKLYGLNFKQLYDIPVYHKDVQVFEVNDKDGSFIGLIYLDYFPREGRKRNGAWMGSFQKQQIYKGNYVHPLIYNVGNFALPTGDKPSLLTLDHVETLFHEFGHGLHGLLSDCTY